jgi:hypothetical protein
MPAILYGCALVGVLTMGVEALLYGADGAGADIGVVINIFGRFMRDGTWGGGEVLIVLKLSSSSLLIATKIACFGGFENL